MKAGVFYGDISAGILTKHDGSYTFCYEKAYLDRPDAQPISFSLPLQIEPFEWKEFPPFFDGLLPEGWLLELSASKFKIDPKDKFSMLLAMGHDGIGAVSVQALEGPGAG